MNYKITTTRYYGYEITRGHEVVIYGWLAGLPAMSSQPTIPPPRTTDNILTRYGLV